ncbi:hypothetical protein BCV69DRAFT_78665 [Microstroma glucosiphilum]|uniref:Uncharacterized protein n=1 Tax=Pseudomicrostroma glucosiphilum TaxID=1684307 RepID=A0A316U028_9BASI|nr:hypothetical protein BCV69DRAFT_78665 [Pseudomicrostroma glucosiphilum]PWN18218.1 hypothetical protein BCV69DRAFT_78665 [Pseudomicrostroma glucosiphilum]
MGYMCTILPIVSRSLSAVTSPLLPRRPHLPSRYIVALSTSRTLILRTMPLSATATSLPPPPLPHLLPRGIVAPSAGRPRLLTQMRQGPDQRQGHGNDSSEAQEEDSDEEVPISHHDYEVAADAISLSIHNTIVYSCSLTPALRIYNSSQEAHALLPAVTFHSTPAKKTLPGSLQDEGMVYRTLTTGSHAPTVWTLLSNTC